MERGRPWGSHSNPGPPVPNLELLPLHESTHLSTIPGRQRGLCRESQVSEGQLPGREAESMFSCFLDPRQELSLLSSNPERTGCTAVFRNPWPGLHKTEEPRSPRGSIFKNASHSPYSLYEKTTGKYAIRKLRIAPSGRKAVIHTSKEAQATAAICSRGQNPREGKGREPRGACLPGSNPASCSPEAGNDHASDTRAAGTDLPGGDRLMS